MSQQFLNNYSTTLSADVATGDTAINVTTAPPTPYGGAAISATNPLVLTLIGTGGVAGGEESSWEIVKVTAISGTTLTVTRGQEGTAAAQWPSGTKIECRATADTLRQAVNQASTTARGQVELAALAESVAGADNTIAVTPGGLASTLQQTVGIVADSSSIPSTPPPTKALYAVTDATTPADSVVVITDTSQIPGTPPVGVQFYVIAAS